MDTKHVRTFVVFSHEGSFRKASQKLHYAPSTLSDHIRTLEEEFHVRLIETTGRSTHLTEAGNAFLPYAESLLKMCRSIYTDLSSYSDIAGPFHIIATETVGLYRLAPIFTQFTKKYPSVKLSVRVGTSNYFPQLLENDDVDIALCQRFAPFPDDRFSSIPLYEIPLVLITSPNHPLAKKKTVTTQDLCHYQLIFPQQEYLDYVSNSLGLSNLKVEMTENLILNSSSLVKRTIKAKRLLSFLPLDAVEEELKNKELVQIPLKCIPLSLTVYAIYRTPPLKQALIDSLISLILSSLTLC